jgi:glycosyltransferase involved in cell wall biosynthesis
MLVSIIIRTYNEEKYLNELLLAIRMQASEFIEYEIVLVDSGSTDNTLAIARAHGCRITHIEKSQFTFGRSLNIGCEFSRGDVLVFISGHCIPVNNTWLEELCRPIVDGVADYVYGCQVGRDTTKYSERRHFAKWFPDESSSPQKGFFCNNANAAIHRKSWLLFRFNEELTGLEDMYLAKQLVASGAQIGYIATAPVYHIHDETWAQVKLRYEREAYALQGIMPEVQFSFVDFIRYFLSGVIADCHAARKEGLLCNKFFEIVKFRFLQFWGTYKGNQEHRKLSTQMKQQYFYPLDTKRGS